MKKKIIIGAFALGLGLAVFTPQIVKANNEDLSGYRDKGNGWCPKSDSDNCSGGWEDLLKYEQLNY